MVEIEAPSSKDGGNAEEIEEGRAVTDRTRSATDLYAAEIDKPSRLLQAGAVNQETYAGAVENANRRMLRSSHVCTDGETRFLQDYLAESQAATAATERALSGAVAGAEAARTIDRAGWNR